MSQPYDDFTAWFNEAPGADAYTRVRGQWVDSNMSADKRFAVFQFQGGGKPDVDYISPQIQVLLLGKKGERATAGALPNIEDFAYSLISRSMSMTCSGGITSIRALQGAPTGPGFTTEDRPWYMLNFELMGCFT